MNFPQNSRPFPRYGAAVNGVASKDGDIYMMGGLVDGTTAKGDLWMVESNGGNLSCFPINPVTEGPGPRVGHASLLVGNAFIVFGGDTKTDDNDTLDDTLYLLNTCKFLLHLFLLPYCVGFPDHSSLFQHLDNGLVLSLPDLDPLADTAIH